MTQTLIDMSRLLAMDAVIILVGMMWDLAVGIRKAMERGEARTSYGLARTATKMLTYYGAFCIGACIDVLLHVGRVWQLVGLADTLESVPVPTGSGGTFVTSGAWTTRGESGVPTGWEIVTVDADTLEPKV